MNFRFKGLLVLLLSAGVWIAAICQWPPATVVPFCFLRALTGLPCPGCGMTRAFHALARRDLLEAFRMNVASPVILLGLCIAAALAILQIAANRDVLGSTWRLSRNIVFGVIVAIMSFAWMVNLYMFLRT